MSQRPAVFLDRDGVLNEVVVRDGAPGSPRSLAELRLVAGAGDTARLRQAGFLVFVITNQPDLARGLLSPEELTAMTEHIAATAVIDDHRVCPHEDRHDCDCRKPKPGMILDLARHWDVDLARSFVVGDMWRDMDAARNAGVTGVLIRSWYNEDVEPDVEVESLTAAIETILHQARLCA
jgi:D-glycero-D-manno-heptose 1,7-bisphosphate phosphatase